MKLPTGAQFFPDPEARRPESGRLPERFWGATSTTRLSRSTTKRIGNPLVKIFENDPNKMFRPYPEVKNVLEELAGRYSLAVIANQHRNVRKHLETTWELAKYFQFMILSEEVGFKKPDREIFLLALDKARIEPSEAWMIGDRVDTDVGPSRSLGMKAVRVLHDSEVSIIPSETEEEVPDFQFKDLNPLLSLF